jgi:hypothetical protein
MVPAPYNVNISAKTTAMLTMNDSCGRSVQTNPAPSRTPVASTSRPANNQVSKVR